MSSGAGRVRPGPRQRAVPRAVVAAGLLAVLTGALLAAWFASGWSEMRGRQRAARDAPRLAAEQRGADLAHDLRGELAALMSREVERPYFHYQNLFHDPRASAGLSVAPSPLVAERDPLVLGYFQLDAHGRTTTPAINDELPELSEPTRLADHRRFRDEVARSLGGPLAPSDAPVVASAAPLVASTAPRVAAATPRPKVKAAPPQVSDHVEVMVQKKPTKVVELDPSIYAQNSFSNEVYKNQKLASPPQAEEQEEDISPGAQPAPAAPRTPVPPAPAPLVPPAPRTPASSAPRTPAPAAPRTPAPPAPRTPAPPAPRTSSPPASRAPAAPVAITVSPLEWRTLSFGGQPTMVAVRQIETPDGKLVQGFVVDRAALTSWLANRAGDAVAELRTGDSAPAEIVPGWHIEVAPNPLALTAAAADAHALARGFVARFVAASAIAILAALLVVLLVARAERLARERSQFAAAAAHELRTPLAGLQLYGDMLADGLGDPGKMRDYARRMSEEASRLGRVVANVLGFSQLERGNLTIEPAVGALDDALRELAERAGPALERTGAALALDVAPELSARFDRDALARIVGNLLDNAEKYSRGAGDRTITLAAREAPDAADPAGAIEVVVSDRGPGIASPAQARLFQAFARGVTADGPAGLGLGLALSQSLARAMGGDLAYRPAPGGGASFVLTLPRR
ncbi:MAG TPA: HAMP domain-containing sensor histidine kinase [Kofleriaceae bacterium]|nr:HAMP domain-containing sensor histidine kinase [Kofleriaceae bacterium]